MTETRYPLQEATALAQELAQLMVPYCDRIKIAGSIRRGKRTVGDIELVASPTIRNIEQVTLFGKEVVGKTNLLFDECLTALIEEGDFVHTLGKMSNPETRMIKGFWRGVKLDLFLVPPSRIDWWGYIYWLRTGPSNANTAALTHRLQGGVAPNHLRFAEGVVYSMGKKVKVPDEKAMFELLELPYIPARERSAERYHREYKKLLQQRDSA